MTIYQGLFMDLPLCIRHANHEDYDVVINIDKNVYYGADYIPSRYHDILEMSNVFPFVAELNGEVASFVCYWLDGVDNTTTASTSGRTLTKYRHLGIYVLTKRLIEDWLKKQYPSLKKHWFVARYSKSLVEITEKANGRLAEFKNHVFCTLSLDDVQSCYHKTKTDIKVTSPVMSELTELLDNEDVLNTLYPRGVCIQADEFEPFVARPGIAEKLIKTGDVYLSGSFETKDLGLSTSFARTIPIGARLIVCYDGISDTSIIKAHLLKAINKLIKSIAGMKVNEDVTVKSINNDASDNDVSENKPPQLLLSVLLPEASDREEIINFINETFHGQVNCDLYSALALYETPYE